MGSRCKQKSKKRNGVGYLSIVFFFLINLSNVFVLLWMVICVLHLRIMLQKLQNILFGCACFCAIKVLLVLFVCNNFYCPFPGDFSFVFLGVGW